MVKIFVTEDKLVNGRALKWYRMTNFQHLHHVKFQMSRITMNLCSIVLMIVLSVFLLSLSSGPSPNIINPQTLWNYNEYNSYLQKLVLYITLEVGERKSFPKNFYKFEKHETGWRFLANFRNKNSFASRKKLSRKQHKNYSFLVFYQFIKLMMTSSKLKKIKISDFMATFHPTRINFKTES